MLSLVKWTYQPWRERTQPERFDVYMRWSLYPLSAVPPVSYTVQLLAGAPVDWSAWLPIIPYVALTVLCLRMLHRTLGGGSIDRRLAAGQLALTVLLVVWFGLIRGPIDFGFLTTTVLAQAMIVTGVAASWVPALTARRVLLLGLSCSVIMVGIQLPHGFRHVLVLSFPMFIWPPIWLSIYATSAWMLRVVRELDQARGTAARLAVAEERLRFSRDLHDVFGRVLATVAVKSELAAELASRRPDDAAAAMFEVRRLAQDSLTEVRAVAAGYRQADLGNELRGARALLDSAGIACSVLGEDLTLSESVGTAFGWAVREAVTNVIRHSAATECTISVSRATAWSRLEVINNGVSSEPAGDGSGLTGLAERLVPLGGRLEARRANDTFTLLVTLPNKD